MGSAAEILVIILSIFLAIFLILGGILVIYLINLTKQIREITKSAEHTVSGLDSLISNAVKMASPMVVAGFISKMAKKFKKDNKEDE